MKIRLNLNNMEKQKAKLVYDIMSIPKGMDVGNLVKIYEQHHVIFWDSSHEKGTKPKLYGVDGTDADLIIVDTKGKEIDLEYYSKQFKDEEYWDKELYKCKNSPIYFWSNFGTGVWPHTSADLSVFTKSLGMEQLEAKDSEVAAKLWEKQKAKVKKSMEFVTIEFLKERKAVIDVLKVKYEQEVKDLEKLLESHVRLVDSNNVPLTERKQQGNLIGKIRKHLPVLPKYSEKYRSNKGKWDSPMLFNTSYAELLNMFYDILRAEDGIEKRVVASTGKLE